MSVERAYRRAGLGAVIALAAMLSVGTSAGFAAERGARKVPPPNGAVTFRSSKDAYNNGVSAFQTGDFAVALPALDFSARNGWLPSKFYLAQIFADNAAPYTDHARAYNLYREIVETAANDIDPDDYHMAPIVSQSIVALGRYTHAGLPEIGLRPDAIRAAEYFNFAANRLNDPDAQYELAKMLLVGDGLGIDVNLALHFYATLVKRGHTSAQASMAEILAQGRHVKGNMIEALALIELALRNAPARDRFWIAEIYQRIFCGSSSDVQKQASGLVAGWQKKYGRPSPPPRDGDLDFEVTAVRECQNGAKVPTLDVRRLDRPGPDLSPGIVEPRQPVERNGALMAVEQAPATDADGRLPVLRGMQNEPAQANPSATFGFHISPLPVR